MEHRIFQNSARIESRCIAVQCECSPDQGMPEVDVPPVASIAVIAVVAVDYQQLALQLVHHHAGLAC